MSGVSVHMKPGVSSKTRVSIVTVDPSTRRIEGAMKDGSMIQIAVWEAPNAFVWPEVGEMWLVHKDGGIWMLDCRQQYSADESTLDITSMAPGQMVLDSNEIFDRAGSRLTTQADLAPSVQTLTLGANWSNFGSGWAPAACWKDPLGVVHLRGLVACTTNESAAAPITTLPVGYRPLYNERFTNYTYFTPQGGSASSTWCWIDVNSDGTVTFETEQVVGTVGNMSLSGITFLAGV